MIPSILCYVPLSAGFLGPTTLPIFKPGSTTPLSNLDSQPPVFQTRLTPLWKANWN